MMKIGTLSSVALLCAFTACGGDDGGGGTVDASVVFDAMTVVDAAVDAPVAPVTLTGSIGGDSVASFDSSFIVTSGGQDIGIAVGTAIDCDTVTEEPGPALVLIIGRCDEGNYAVNGTLDVDPTECEAQQTGAFVLVERNSLDSETGTGGSVMVSVDGTELTTTLNVQLGTDTVSGTVRSTLRCSIDDL